MTEPNAKARVVETKARLTQQVAESDYLNSLRGTSTYRLIATMQRVANKVAPQPTRRGRLVHASARAAAVLIESGPKEFARRARRRLRRKGTAETGPLDFDAEYRRWLSIREPNAQQLVSMRTASRSWTNAPLISVIMPVFDSDAPRLDEAIESVRSQAYEEWEVCIADDASTPPHVREILLRHQAADSRILVAFRDRNGSIAASSNSALALAGGEYVAFLDQDDILRPHALYSIVEYLRKHPNTDIVYSDEDKILPDGRRGAVFFKPDWSPDWLLSHNYIGHLVVLRRSLITEIQGFRLGYDGSQNHDLLLRASERASHVGHIPDVLYSRRQVASSAALSSDAKPDAPHAGHRAVADALRRRHEKGTVEHSALSGIYNIRYEVAHAPRVAIVIPTRDRIDLLRRCIAELQERLAYTNFEIVIVDNDSRDTETLRYLETSRHRVVRASGAFNYSRLVNLGVRSTNAPFVLLLNNDAFVRTPDALEQLIGYSQRPEIGAVGCQLRYPDGRLQHCGVGLIGFGAAFNLHVDWPVPVVRDVSAVTAACMMTRRSVFDEVGGFDEGIAIAFNDVDFCLRVRQCGYRIVYTPQVQFEHAEGASRGRLHPTGDSEIFRIRWAKESELRDPYLNPNLDWQHDDRPHVID